MQFECADLFVWLASYNPASQIVIRTRDSDAYGFTGYASVNRTYAVNGLNQYSTTGTASFSYDANGNLAGDGINSYTYDIENRLSGRGALSLEMYLFLFLIIWHLSRMVCLDSSLIQ